MKRKIFIVFILLIMICLVGCGKNDSKSSTSSSKLSSGNGLLKSSDIFTDRDLEQTADTSNAVNYNVSNGEDITITEEGVYVITGSSNNTSIIVNASDDAKVQVVLSDLTISNDSSPCIYVKNADKVFVTTVGSNNLTVSGTFIGDGDTNCDAVIFSKDDLVINGKGTLTISSSYNGITSKDDLKITGGTIVISSVKDALEANNSIAIADGNITINSEKDGVHAEYDEDESVGYFYMLNGTLNITAIDDAVHATTIIQVDGGTINLNAREGLEATYVQINSGTINITASDDGINAGDKSSKYSVTVEINGGTISIDMGQGDTDAIDSNGNLYINGGTVSINAQSPFDYDGESSYKWGTIIVNGEETNEITNQMMGGPGGRPGGDQGGRR